MSWTSKALTWVATLVVLALTDTWAAPNQPSIAGKSGSAARDTLQEVTVTARRAQLAKQVSKFAEQITTLENEESLARWNSPVCALALGLNREVDDFIRERISAVARAAGVRLAGERCRPNLFLIVTANPKKLLSGLSNRGRIIVFGDVLSPCSDASTADVNAFIAKPRIVRVWYQSQLTDQWGGVNQGCGVPAEATRLSWNGLYRFLSVWVIADYTKLRDVSVGQFADYVAMVGLAKIKPGTNLGDSPSILQLFRDRPHAAPPGLTDWDLAFLKALYSTEQRSVHQRSQIARTMTRELAH